MSAHTSSQTRGVIPTTAIKRSAVPGRTPHLAGGTRRANRFVLRAATEEVSANGTGPQANPPLDFEELSDLIRMVHDSDIVELELKHKGFNLAVRKKEALEEQIPVQAAMPAPVAHMAAAAVPAAPAPAPAPAAPAAPAASRAPQPEAASDSVPDGLQILSPMAGSFYRCPAPGEPSFTKEGDKVRVGQTVCIIEAMKLMNEIEAETAGEVVKILVENGEAVTPGQPLMIIK